MAKKTPDGSFLKNHKANPTAKAPFRKSRQKTRRPQGFPKIRLTLVAPAFLLPKEKMSNPFALHTITAKDTLPQTYEARKVII